MLIFLGHADIAKLWEKSRTWRDVVDAHETELRLARCNALDLLPTTGFGVLKALADETHTEAVQTMRSATADEARARLAAVYRGHYMRWKGHVCRNCEPVDWSSSCGSCTRPQQIRWFRYIHERCGFMGARRREFDDFVRRMWCSTPPYVPLSHENTGVFLRYDDPLEFHLAPFSSRPFARQWYSRLYPRLIRAVCAVMC